MVLRFPLRAINLVMAARHESASKVDTVPTCTALDVKHVKNQHHRFFDFLMTFTSNGPEWSILVLANGKIFSSSLSFGRSAMKGLTPPICCFLHLTHFNFTFLRALRSPIIQ